MTANPDSALRQALVAAEKALQPFAEWANNIVANQSNGATVLTHGGRMVTLGDFRRAREAHALITEALAQSQDKP